MAMHIPKPQGFLSMMKDGASFFKGQEETMYRNIDACEALSETLQSTYGPRGMKKMIINHMGKKFISKDASTILRELEVEHPVAKMMVMASQQQEEESGEGTNFVLLLCAKILTNAETILRMGLSVSDVNAGIETAAQKVLSEFKDLTVGQVSNLRDRSQVSTVIRASLQSKIFDYADVFTNLITDACISTLPQNNHFNVDNIRVVKILGGGIEQSQMLKGLVFLRAPLSTITEVSNAKIAVFTCPLDALQTETKGTVLINNAEELMSFSKGEECDMEAKMKALAGTGCKVVVTGGKVGDLALHYANYYKLMVVRLMSKFDVRRVCKLTGASPIPKFVTPTSDQLGTICKAKTDEIGRETVVIFEQDQREESVATIVVRGSINNLLDEVERAIDDGVNSFKVLTKDPRYVAGAGALEMQLASRLNDLANRTPGLEQYSIRAVAQSFTDVVAVLCENFGEKANERIAELISGHQAGKRVGIVYSEDALVHIKDPVPAGVIDLYGVKYWAIRFAVDTAKTILSVNEIIMARQAGGPKPRQPGPMDEDD